MERVGKEGRDLQLPPIWVGPDATHPEEQDPDFCVLLGVFGEFKAGVSSQVQILKTPLFCAGVNLLRFKTNIDQRRVKNAYIFLNIAF